MMLLLLLFTGLVVNLSLTVTTVTIKDVFSRAKIDSNYINEASLLALDHIKENKLITSKDAMNAVSIFKLAKDANSVVQVIENFVARNLALDTALFNNAIDCCAKVSDWELSMKLLRRMKELGVTYDKISFSSAITACAKSGRWKESLKLLHEMDTLGIVADTICFSSAISACAGTGRWIESLTLLAAMKKKNIPVDAIAVNSAITSCGPGGEWTIALRLMAFMKVEGLKPNAYTYAAAINACDVGGQCDEALRLLDDMLHEQQQKQQQSGGSTFPPLSAVPFNAAIAAAVRCGRMLVAKELFDRMKSLGISRTSVTYTTLILGIAKSKWKQFDPIVVMEIHKEMVHEKIPRNAAVFGAVLSAAERIGDVDTALQLLSEMKSENIPTTNFVYHSVISACSKAGRYTTARILLDEMKARGIERNEVTYSLMIGSCKEQGRWRDALDFITEMEQDHAVMSIDVVDTNPNTTFTDDRIILSTSIDSSSDSIQTENESMMLKSDELISLKPGTVVYSTAIAVCVASKEWSVALELLEKMENAGISRNVVTYNTVIEALSAAGETVRAELVYQGALRAGIYNHWHRHSPYNLRQTSSSSSSELLVDSTSTSTTLSYTNNTIINDINLNPRVRAWNAPTLTSTPTSQGLGQGLKSESPAVMDLHNFPVAVAQAAVMHVLGEMCMGGIPVGDPLIIITGRGNHQHAKGQRGVLKKELLELGVRLGLELLSDEDVVQLPSSNSLPSSQPSSISSRNVIINNNNPGRLWLTKAATEAWLEKQKQDDEQRRSLGSAGGAHGNLFLQVARAKHKRLPSSTVGGMKGVETRSSIVNQNKVPMGETSATSSVNVRAVCPFSSATLPPPLPLVDTVQTVNIVVEKKNGGGCPAHALVPAVPVQGNAKGGGCPAHTATNAKGTIVHDTSIPKKENDPLPISQEVEGKPKGKGCPAHATASAMVPEK